MQIAGLPESLLLVEIEFSKMENLVVSCGGRSGGKVGEFEFKWVWKREGGGAFADDDVPLGEG